MRRSSGAPTDQLAREWLALRAEMRRVGADRFHLVYVTADLGMPRGDIDESLVELHRKCFVAGDAPADIAWLSWRRLPRVLADAEEPILRDLHVLMRRAMLVEFEGIALPLAEMPPLFEFQRLQVVQHLAWSTPPAGLPYAFESQPPQASLCFMWSAAPAAVRYDFDARPAFRWTLPDLPQSAAWGFSP